MEDAERRSLSNAERAADLLDDTRLAAVRRLVAELFGTFALTFVAAGGGVVAAVSAGVPDAPTRAIAPGLLVMAMIYSLGPLSGAHLNPAVTYAFALRGNFPWHRVPGYVIAQVAGACLAAGVLRALFGNVAHLGATQPRHGVSVSLGMEIVLTFVLVTVILATAANFRIVGHNAALAVGGTVILSGLFAGPISGASMNPARSLGPALVTGDLTSQWIYIVGPFIGAVIAVGFAWVLRGSASPAAAKAASGELP
jgi:aquaporin Z